MASAEAPKGPENIAQGFREAQPVEEERVEKARKLAFFLLSTTALKCV